MRHVAHSPPPAVLHWPTQLALLAAILFLLHRLPALGTLPEALLAGCLAVAAVWVITGGAARREAAEAQPDAAAGCASRPRYAVPALAEQEG